MIQLQLMPKKQQKRPITEVLEQLTAKITNPEPYHQLSSRLSQHFSPHSSAPFPQLIQNISRTVFDSDKYTAPASDVMSYLQARQEFSLGDVVKTIAERMVDTRPYLKLAQDLQRFEVESEEDAPEGWLQENEEEDKPKEKQNTQPLEDNAQNKEILEQSHFIPKETQPEEQWEVREAEPNVTSPLPFRKVSTELRGESAEEKVERQTSNPIFKVPDDPVLQDKGKSRNMSSSEKEGRKGSAESKNNRVLSSQSSFQMDLTLKTKLTKNNISSNTYGRADSLVYSNATLMNSNSNPFGPEHRVKSHHSVLHKIENEKEEEQFEKIERAVSRQIARGERSSNTERSKSSRVNKSKQSHAEREAHSRKVTETENLKTSRDKSQVEEELGGQRRKSQASDGGVFHTQIKEYKSKIAKIRELKEQRKRKLEAELKRVNQEIDTLARKESQVVAKNNNYESRVKISDNAEAKVKAERLVKDLRQEKRSRQEAHLGDLHSVDKNINFYMEELMKERYKNEERLKQRKKFEIIERMKQQEMRKIEEQKQKEKNLHFLAQLKQSNSRNGSIKPPTPPPLLPSTIQRTPPEEQRRRSPTKASEKTEELELSPELSRKKEYLKKIRNLKFVHKKIDLYEQSLM